MPINTKHALKLAIGAAILAGASQANAFTAFKSSGPQSDELTIKGRVAYEYDRYTSGDKARDHGNSGTRTGIGYTHHFNDDFAVLGYTEWGYDPFFRNGPDNRANKLNYNKRQQYAGVTYKDFGTLTYGKQNSIYGMVTDATDQYWVYGAAANGKDGMGHLVGADRPDNTLKYKNTLGDFTFGAMYGGNYDKISGEKRRHFEQAGVNWQVAPQVTIGTAYNHAAMTRKDGRDHNVDEFVVSGTWTPGNWTIGVLAGQYHNELGTYKYARGYETFTQYTFKDALSFGDMSLYGGLNRLEDRKGPGRSSSYILGTALKTHKGFASKDNFIVALEHSFNDNKDSNGQNNTKEQPNHDTTSLLLRYNY